MQHALQYLYVGFFFVLNDNPQQDIKLYWNKGGVGWRDDKPLGMDELL
jgi:hypothetical protein